MQHYKVYYTKREEEDLDFKADLFTEQDKPENADAVEFDAANDKDAKTKIQSLIIDGDKRPVRGIGKLSQCRPKGKSGNNLIPVLLNLNNINEPLKTKLFDALTPLIDSGDLIEDDLQLRPKTRDMLNVPVRTRKKKDGGEPAEETEEQQEQPQAAIA